MSREGRGDPLKMLFSPLLSWKASNTESKASTHSDFPGGSDGKETACHAGDPGSIPGSGRVPWGRTWQPTPVFLPGELCGQRSQVGYSLWGCKGSDTTEQPTLHFTHTLHYLPTESPGLCPPALGPPGRALHCAPVV